MSQAILKSSVSYFQMNFQTLCITDLTKKLPQNIFCKVMMFTVICKNFFSSCNVHELLFCSLFLCLILEIVRMPFLGKFPVSFGNLLLAGVASESQDLVVISFWRLWEKSCKIDFLRKKTLRKLSPFFIDEIFALTFVRSKNKPDARYFW